MAWKQVKQPNLDPVIYQGGAALDNWLGWCLAYVQSAFGASYAGPSAWASWSSYTKKRHHDRDLPRGVYVPIWFDGYWNGQRYGHVAIYKDGKIWSSPISSKPYADAWTSIEQVEKNYGMRYVGWSEDVAGTAVIKYQAPASSAASEGGDMTEAERKVYNKGLVIQSVKKLSEGSILFEFKADGHQWKLDSLPAGKALSAAKVKKGHKIICHAYVDLVYKGKERRYYITETDLTLGRLYGVNREDVKIVHKWK